MQLSPDEYLPFSNLILYFTVSRLIEFKEKRFQIGQHDFIISRLPHYVRHMTLICTTLNPFCPVWLNLAIWFLRKCHWCLSNVNRQTDRQTMNNTWPEKFPRAVSFVELKRFPLKYRGADTFNPDVAKMCYTIYLYP